MAKINIERYKKRMKEHEKVLRESDERIAKIRENTKRPKRALRETAASETG